MRRWQWMTGLLLAVLGSCGTTPTGTDAGDETTSSTSSGGTGTGTEGDGGSTEDEESDGGEESDTGCPFQCQVDLPPGPEACDIWDPDSCFEGDKCTAYATMGSSWDANKCVPIMGDGEPGDDCVATDGSGVSGNDDCGKGSMCWDIAGDTMTGYCVAFCTGSPDEPSCGDQCSATICAIYNNGVLPLCLPSCDPINGGADCANPENLCISDPGGQGFICVLGGGQMGEYGSECQYANSCDPGLLCAPADRVPDCQGAQGCCTYFCDTTMGNTCPDADKGQECVPWYEMGEAPCGFEHVGMCLLP